MNAKKWMFPAVAIAAATLFSGDEAFAKSAKSTLDASAALGDDCCAKPACCPQPCITYRHRGCEKICCGCAPPIETVLKVMNPCTCCVVEIPVCLSACCQGEPRSCSRCGLFGRGVVRYEWCCGFSVNVTFKRCGDVVVTYIGR